MRIRRFFFLDDRQLWDRLGDLAGWSKGRGYEEPLVTDQIDKARKQDRVALLEKANLKQDHNGGGRVLLVTTYHPALNNLGKVAGGLHYMLKILEEHRKVFPQPPLISFKRC